MAKNIKDILVEAASYPAAVEASLPAGAPKISTMLADAASKLPLPDLPVEIPDLPAPPALPEMPAPPGGAGLRVAEVKPAPAAAVRRVIPFVYE